jgi:hypothetical protein
MKTLKNLIILVTLISVLLIPVSVHADIFETILNIDSVFYEQESQYYLINCIDENGEGWIIELFQAEENKTLTIQLNTILKGQWIEAKYNTYDNTDLYDDEIIQWKIIK